MEDDVVYFSEDLVREIVDCMMNGRGGLDYYFRVDEKLKKQIISELLKVYSENSLIPNDEMIASIVQRLLIFMENGVSGIEDAATARDGKINYLTKSISPVYGVEFASKNRVVLFEFFEQVYSYGGFRDDKNRPIVVSLDLDRGRLFIQKITYRSERGRRIDMSINTYCLPSAREVGQRLKRFARDVTDRDSIDKIFICDSFHPGRMDKFVHDNLIDKLDISKEEKVLLEKIIHKKAPEPHFHIYSDKISSSLDENGKSLAINILDLSKYLNILVSTAEYLNIDVLTPEVIKKLEQDKNLMPDVLKYDLFMPYLSILKGDIEYKSDGMIEKIKQLLSDYNSRQSTRIANITQIYEMLSNIRTGDGSFEQGGKTGIGGLRAIARDIEILSKCMEYLPDELQMLIKDLYDKNFKLNTEFLTKKAAEMGIELPFEFVMPAPVDVLATDTNVNSKPKPTPNTNGN